MGGRIILAALVGGALMFAGGFVEHGILGWVGRQIHRPAEEPTANDDFKKHFPNEGMYSLPPMPQDMQNLSKEQQSALNEAYKKGPSALIVVAPTGQDMMGPMQLGGEFATNFLCALLASIIVAMLRPDVGFAGRWAAVFLIGIITWLAVNASYFLWYRFAWPWVQDELFCAMVEWSAAGIAIAAIVRPTGTPVGAYVPR
jgi:hypothetical protein